MSVDGGRLSLELRQTALVGQTRSAADQATAAWPMRHQSSHRSKNGQSKANKPLRPGADIHDDLIRVFPGRVWHSSNSPAWKHWITDVLTVWPCRCFSRYGQLVEVVYKLYKQAIDSNPHSDWGFRTCVTIMSESYMAIRYLRRRSKKDLQVQLWLGIRLYPSITVGTYTDLVVTDVTT